MSGPPHRVPAQTVEHEIAIKKSRFIARAVPAASRRQALDAVAAARADYPDARHHCWAYLLGNPATAASAATNDDGEPSGTAGKPILNVIQHKGIGDVIVVVTRYFGGIKLGAGGLTRAYGAATEAVLSITPLIEHVARFTVRLTGDFADEQPLRHWAAAHQAEVVDVRYAAAVTLIVDCPQAHQPALAAFCAARRIDMADCTAPPFA